MKSITRFFFCRVNSREFASLRPQTERAYSITLTCMPRQMPKYGTLFSRAQRHAQIMPSMPRLPNPPGTSTPAQSPSSFGAVSSVTSSLSIQTISTAVPSLKPACASASTMDIYASCRRIYLPQMAMRTVLCVLCTLLTISTHSVRSGSWPLRRRWRQATRSSPSCCNISGASYSEESVRFSMTQSGLTLQNSAILRLRSSSIGSSTRATITSGAMPMACNSLTECCVGFDLNSPDACRNGTSVTWTNRQLLRPTSQENWRMASRNGWLSISPIVPPISVMSTSALLVFAPARMNALISFVTCGMICTVCPRYSPRRSRLSTVQ